MACQGCQRRRRWLKRLFCAHNTYEEIVRVDYGGEWGIISTYKCTRCGRRRRVYRDL